MELSLRLDEIHFVHGRCLFFWGVNHGRHALCPNRLLRHGLAKSAPRCKIRSPVRGSPATNARQLDAMSREK